VQLSVDHSAGEAIVDVRVDQQSVASFAINYVSAGPLFADVTQVLSFSPDYVRGA